MTQLEKDRLIEKFMGYELKWANDVQSDRSGWYFVNKDNNLIDKVTYANSTIGFTTDWNWLMKALHRFDNLTLGGVSDFECQKYIDLCDNLDSVVTLYNIDDAVNALCEGIEWYNSTLN